jgi:polysaccharide export outer membrane protein
MKHERTTIRLTALVTILLCAALFGPGARGQEVMLQRGDMLELSVTQRPELGFRATIDDAGNIEVPVIGTVHLEGMMLDEAESTILRRMREVYPSVRQVRLLLIGEDSKRFVYVHGQVVSPGKYEFRETPNVWEAIREAGGTTVEASLGAVRIVRAEEGEERTSIVNLRAAIDSGDFESLPLLKPGDTVIVPERSMQYQGSGAVNVIGSVLNPAPYMLTGERRLVDAIIAAGGTTPDADLSEVCVIRALPNGGTMTIEVDFGRYLERGDLRHNPIVEPNDTVSVPSRGSLMTVLSDARILLGLFTAAMTTLAIVLTR